MDGLSKFVKLILRRLVGVGAAAALTLVFFLVLPLMQTITQQQDDSLKLQEMDVSQLPPPPPPPEPEPEEEEPEPEQEQPELEEPQEVLDLNQLELMLSPGIGTGALAGDMKIDVSNVLAGSGDEAEGMFDMSDLDQRPRVLYQAAPQISAEMRRRVPATVNILFIVDERGRVENPVVHSSTDPIFERAALNAVRQWRFEPGQRSGEPVRFRMRVPITFPKD